MLPGSPVLDPNPHGTFPWPTSESPFTPFLPVLSLLRSSEPLRESSAWLLHLAFLLPRRGQGSPLSAPKTARLDPHVAAMPGFKSLCESSSISPFPAPPTIGHTCQHSRNLCLSWLPGLVRAGVGQTLSKLTQVQSPGELPPTYIPGQSHAQLPSQPAVDMQNNWFCISGMKLGSCAK